MAVASCLLASCLTACSSVVGGPGKIHPPPAKQLYLDDLQSKSASSQALGGLNDSALLALGYAVCRIDARPQRHNYPRNPVNTLVHEGHTRAAASTIVHFAKHDLC
ncbi:MAG: hypothetical protein INR71_06300 [Terriglobus roseus]|nr:hypothetical protein [Terriglobus roseus]